MCNIDPQIQINDYFISCFTNGNNNYKLNSTEILNCDKFVFKAGVSRAMLKIKSNAVGLDVIHIRFLKIIMPFLIQTLTHILNVCLTTSVYS